MKTVVTINNTNLDKYIKTGTNSFIFPLKDYAVDYENYFTLEEIKQVKNSYKNIEIFIVINKTLFNDELENIQNILKEIESISIDGIFFYDLAVLQLTKELGLETPLVWNQTHMVTNYNTCNYYKEKGCKYAQIAGELSKEEILELIEKTDIKLFYTLFSLPVVAHSVRKLLTNSAISSNKEIKDKLLIHEKVSKKDYLVVEDNNGTTFFYNSIINNFEILKEINVEYLILKNDFIKEEIFISILSLTNDYLNKKITFKDLSEKVEGLIGNDNIFLNEKTIYKVKKESGAR